ncbi:restriction endonuclease subunit S [bacterium C-53]|nr:restriction endonuclease subunit S [Lachnospiraceae bacterium]NBI02837.1 restriction endonuclease subunit S [Lachnospiraceae bacterium]RKJ10965.1 restriction endonuclease subunit S [bacterium C-53]
MSREMKDSGIEWIGEIPKDWEIRNIKYLFSFGKGLNITKENLKEQGVAVISYGQIHSKLNPFYKISDDLIRFVDESYLKTGNLSLVNQGDFIFADTSEDVQGCGNFIYVDGQQTMFAGYHTIILRSLAQKDNKFFAFLFMSDCWRKQIRECVNGVKLFSISQKLIKKTSILIPPEDEKVRIVNYLEEHCVTVDNVLEKTCANIEEYKKLKQAVITQAVTKGIRGNRELKDNGIEWIGEIPVEWEERRIKTLFNLRKERNFSPLEEVNLISLYTDLGVVQHSELEKTTGNKASNADGYKTVYRDDIVVNIILCWMGAIGRSEYNGVTSPAYDVYIPRNEVLSKFYHYYFRTKGFSGDCYKRGKGIMAMRWRTYSDQFRDIRVVYPSLEEQREIVNYLDQKCAAIDELIAKKEQYLSEIENYKKSLIYEYVTGKKKVPQE